MRIARFARADARPTSHSAAANKQVVRMRNGYSTRGVGFGDSNHDPPCDGAYLTSTPTMRPATFIRTSHDQNVAFSNGRTLSYHTPLPTVDNAMVHNQRSVANSIPARGRTPCSHNPPLSR